MISLWKSNQSRMKREEAADSRLLLPAQQLGDQVNTKQFVVLQLKGHQCHLVPGPAIPLGKTANWQSRTSKANSCSCLKQPRIHLLFLVIIRRHFSVTHSDLITDPAHFFEISHNIFLKEIFAQQFSVELCCSLQVIPSLSFSFEAFSCIGRE